MSVHSLCAMADQQLAPLHHPQRQWRNNEGPSSVQDIAPDGHTVRASTSALAKLLAWQQDGALSSHQVRLADKGETQRTKGAPSKCRSSCLSHLTCMLTKVLVPVDGTLNWHCRASPVST